MRPRLAANVRREIERFEIYDCVHGSFRPYNPGQLLNRKIYYVPYFAREAARGIVGGGNVMIFDQVTGELLYDGTDGGE